MRSLYIPCLALLFGLFGCNSSPAPKGDSFEPEQITTKTSDVSEIIYSLYLPTDMAAVLDETGTNYDPAIPASIDNYTLYNDEEQIAVMLGVYGVDMMYMKLLGQMPTAASYFQVMQNLAGRTDIPDRIFSESLEKLEAYADNQDSIASLIEEMYMRTDTYYREAGKENLSTLSLMGGWVETMYIGADIMESDGFNTMMAERILQQKYSLNSIFTMLRNHQETYNSRGYMLLLKKLKSAFDKVEIKYEKEGFKVDTASRKIQSGETHITYTRETLDEITRLIRLIRQELIKPTP